MGIMAISPREGMEVDIEADGQDENEAVAAMSDFLRCTRIMKQEVLCITWIQKKAGKQNDLYQDEDKNKRNIAGTISWTCWLSGGNEGIEPNGRIFEGTGFDEEMLLMKGFDQGTWTDF